MEITKDDFEAYEAVRLSGATNMFDTDMIEQLSGLDHDTILEIMKNYGNYKQLYIDNS